MKPRRRRPPFKGYGLARSDEGMLPWSWVAERLEGLVTTGSRLRGRTYFTPGASGETDPWFVVRPERAYAWNERDYTASATQFDFD